MLLYPLKNRIIPATSAFAFRTFKISQNMAQTIPKTMKAAQIFETGEPEIIQLNEVPVPAVGASNVLIRTEWAGINYIDNYYRTGLYPIKLPFTLGQELAGEVVAIGSDVDVKKYGLKIGDKVAGLPFGGSFAEYVSVLAQHVVKLPENVSTKDGATVLLQGMTAEMLVREYHQTKPGDYVLVHAAAGGMGLLLCQMLKFLGAHVIGTTSTHEKATLAKDAGAEHIVLYADRTMDDVAKELKSLTPDGEGFNAVIDGVGKDTFLTDFDLLRRRGSLVLFGNASGPAPVVNPAKLAPKSLKMSRPLLPSYAVTHEEFQHSAGFVFELIAKGAMRLTRHKEDGYPLTREGLIEAYKDMSGRKTTGKLVVKV